MNVIRIFLLCLFCAASSWSSLVAAEGKNSAWDNPGSPPIELGRDRRQLLVDRHLIAEMRGAALTLHHPQPREIAIKQEHPWEEGALSYMTTFKDGGKFRAWYRAEPRGYFQAAAEDAGMKAGRKGTASFTAYAESEDGIHWIKPKLGIVEFEGSTENNLVWVGAPGSAPNLAPFRDDNPEAKKDERYKAIVRRKNTLEALVSPDGLRWRLARKEPILIDPPFDTLTVAFWDPENREYVIYTRGRTTTGDLGRGMTGTFGGPGGTRTVRRATSKNFLDWSKLKTVELGGTPREEFYTNSAIRYDRAPDYMLMLPTRFASGRMPLPGIPAAYANSAGVTDIVLLSSRDGVNWDREHMEAFIRPGLDQQNWIDRAFYMERGILQTSSTELSFYVKEHWWVTPVHIRRYTLRVEGFSSVQAPYEGGEFTTKLLVFDGGRLEINYSTSAIGSLRVEIQDRNGKPIEGYRLEDCPEIFGDRIDQIVGWKSGADLGRLAGHAVRFRFVLHDADIFSFCLK